MDFNHKYKHNFILSAEFTYENSTLAAEFSAIKTDFNVPNPVTGQVTTLQVDPQGYYFQGFYRFFYCWSCAGTIPCTIGTARTRTASCSSTPDAPTTWPGRKTPPLRFGFRITSYWLLKFKTHFIDGVAQLHSFDNMGGYTQDWKLFAVKTTFNF